MLNMFLSFFGISFGIILVIVILNARRNDNTIRCDMCGKRYTVDEEEYYIVKNDIVCTKCYNIMMNTRKER